MSTPTAAELQPGARRRRVRLAAALALGLVLLAGEALFSWWTLGPLLGAVLTLLGGDFSSCTWGWTSVVITLVCFGGWLFGATTRTLVMLLFLDGFALRRVLLLSYGVDFAVLVVLLVAARAWGSF
ncbi:hypothetical protein [Kineococcus sp. SYSU DK005]|uniref:hypothetical protein n=1 Tax=Kineococcus sp. SYSU DK005 TaxID=3383126 RepID=UPI003D7D0AD8